MSSGAIVLTAVLILITSVIAVVSIEKYKVTVLKDAVTRLTDLISILDGIGLNSDFIDRGAKSDKVKTLVRRYDRIMVVSIDGLRSLRNELQVILIKYE